MGIQSSVDIKARVLEAFDTLFNKRDYARAAEFWSESYIQHSAHIPPGRDGLFNLVRSAPPELRYENHTIAVDGDFVLLHGRFTGNGRPRAWIAGDVVRMEHGRLAEHWDTLQDEVTQEESKSGLPMFGNAFAKPTGLPEAGSAVTSLTKEEARAIVAPLYDALNQPGNKDVAALLAKAANPDYKSYHTNEEWLSRDQLAECFEGSDRPSPICAGPLRTSRRLATKSSSVEERPVRREGNSGGQSRRERASTPCRSMFLP